MILQRKPNNCGSQRSDSVHLGTKLSRKESLEIEATVPVSLWQNVNNLNSCILPSTSILLTLLKKSLFIKFSNMIKRINVNHRPTVEYVILLFQTNLN